MKRWPRQKAYFWETAPFFRLLLPLIAGILLYPLWKGSNTVALFTAGFSYLLFIAIAAFKVLAGLRQLVTFFSLHGFLLFFSFSLCYFNDVRNRRDWFGHHVNTADLFVVRLTEPPSEKEKVWKLEVEVLETILPRDAHAASGRAFVYAYTDKALPVFHKGDTLLVPNLWEPVQNPGNPFEFNYSLYCSRNNIHYAQYIAANDIMVKGASVKADLSFTEAAHNWCMQVLQQYVADRQALGLVQSMLIGDEVNLDSDLRDAFSETGIVHVIAISGGNIAVVFFMVLVLLRWLRHKKYLWLKYALALPLVWFYVLMAGSSPSAVRAALMFSLLALGFMLQRRLSTNSLNHLFATAFILLLAQPMWLFAIGFQLSFVAVLSLILFYRHIYRCYVPANRVARALWSVIAASLSAEILVFPLVIYYFHTFPLLFIVSNVLAYLLMGLVLVLGISVIAFSFIPALAKLIATAVSAVVTLFTTLIGVLRRLEPSSFQTLRLTGAELFLVYLMVAFLALYLLQRKMNAALFAAAMACLLLASFCFNKYRDLEQRRVVVYNAGKALRIESIEGEVVTSLFTSGLQSSKKKYLLSPAHIGWQALREKQGGEDLLLLNGKKILILKASPLSAADILLVDEVILAYSPLIKDLPQIKQNFNPSRIILAQTMSESQLIDWKILCRKEGIALHPVQEGACILE